MKTVYTILIVLWSLQIKGQNYDIYVSDAGNFSNPPWQILKFDQNGQNPVVFINTNLSWPQDILFLEDQGQVLISNLNSGKICRHDANTGVFLSDFATGIAGPTRMKIGPDSLLYVLQWSGNGKVRRYQLNGTYVGEFTSAGVPQSIGIDWDANNNLYVSSYTGALVRKFDANGMDQGIFINSNLLGPTNIWFDDTGDLLVADYNGTSVNRFDFAGSYIGPFITGLGQCEGVAFLPSGNILIGNGATNSVRMFDASGTYLQDLILPGSGNLLNPNAVVIRTTSTSLEEHGTREGVVLFPSAGNEFHISDKYRNEIQTIFIYQITGKLIRSIDAGELAKTIRMQDVAPGALLVKTKMQNGTFIMQRIMLLE